MVSIGISLLALAISFLTLYRTHLMQARVKVSPGDSIDIVRPIYNSIAHDSIQVACTFTNDGAQTGVIEKLAVILHPTDKPPILFNWSIFFSYQDGHRTVPKEKVHSLPILARQTHFEGVQFSIADQVDWAPGKYRLELLGWSNRTCEKEPNLRHLMSITVSEQLVKDLAREPSVPLTPILHTVMLDGFEIASWPKDG